MPGVTHAQIEPTTRCNYTCGFCVGRSMVQQDLAWDAFSAFLERHPDLRHVELQGEGEPLLHRRFDDMLAACRDRGITVSIITNGSLLDPASVERLLAAGLHSIHVSMESADPAVFQRIRGGKFAKVLDGLQRLMARRTALGLVRPVVGLTVTVLRDTLETMPAIFGLYRDLALDGGVVLQPLQAMSVYSNVYSPDLLDQRLDPAGRKRFADYRRAFARAAPVRSPSDFFYSSLFAGFDPARDPCPWLAKGSYLGAGGAVTACCFMKDAGHASPVGDRSASVARNAALIAAMEAGTMPPECAGCGTAGAIVRARQSSAVPAVSR